MHGDSDTHHRTADAPAHAPVILIVEDNPVNQQVTLRMLMQLGYQADVAGDGMEAILATESREYAAILMDCHMPGMDGLTATRWIRGIEVEGSRLPIIALTASTRPDDRSTCLAAGMDDYLSKPVRAHELALVLDRWIR